MSRRSIDLVGAYLGVSPEIKKHRSSIHAGFRRTCGAGSGTSILKFPSRHWRNSTELLQRAEKAHLQIVAVKAGGG